jgi:peptidoglycan/xylan/chitin deacetylase (PgdA/CDA1 family)
MTADQLRAWIAAGHEVGSHTHTHAPLPRCQMRRVEQELVLSRSILEEQLGSAVEHFSFSWGQWNPRVCAVAARLGYRTLATIDRGVNRRVQTPALLRRDIVHPAWSCMRMHFMIGWGRTALYRLQRRLRKAPGYWDRHPEEKWTPLDPVKM